MARGGKYNANAPVPRSSSCKLHACINTVLDAGDILVVTGACGGEGLEGVRADVAVHPFDPAVPAGAEGTVTFHAGQGPFTGVAGRTAAAGAGASC